MKNKKEIYRVGQIVRNKLTGKTRRITKVSKGILHWISKDSKNKGQCITRSMTNWSKGYYILY